jgi:hypothetical protein
VNPSCESFSDVDAALEDVARRLAASLNGGLPAETVGRIVEETAAQWRDARVRSFVPILVERYSRRIGQVLDAADQERSVA